MSEQPNLLYPERVLDPPMAADRPEEPALPPQEPVVTSPDDGSLASPGVTSETNGVLALIERLAVHPGVNVEIVERLLAVQERVLAREAESAFNEAMARLAAKLAEYRIVKTRVVAYGKGEAFKYAPLEDIDKVLRPLLIEEEMVLTDTTIPREGGSALVVTRVTHRNGAFKESAMPLPLDTSGGKSNVQAMGSTLSYGRRYNRCNLFNVVVVDDDDDGTGGTIDEAQAKTIREKMKEAGADEPRFLKYMHARSVEEIAFRDYRKAVSALEEKIEKTAKEKAQ